MTPIVLIGWVSMILLVVCFMGHVVALVSNRKMGVVNQIKKVNYYADNHNFVPTEFINHLKNSG